MSTSKAARHFPWRDLWAMLLVLTGLVLIALSVVWPSVSTSRSGWSDDKALAYQSASAEMHRLSMQAAGGEPEQQTRAFRDELAEAEARYAELRAELDAARGRPGRIAAVLRYTGILLLIGGVAGLAWRGEAARD
jgi:hypothetical protein